MSPDKQSSIMTAPAVNVHLRSSLVAQEPLKVRSPIYGLFRGLTAPDHSSSLADALAPLIQAIQNGQVVDLAVHDLRMAIVYCHNNGVDVKQFQEAGKPSKLSVAGIAAINLYSGEFVPPQFYSVLNAALRDANREKCKPFVPYIWLLMHALRDCPLYPNKVVFRGVKADLSAHYPKDREVTWFQFSSCTCDLSVEQSEQFCGSSGARTLFTIELTTGRARLITQYSLVPSEAEVLLPPNCRFKVKGVLDAGNGLIQIQLEELPCLEPILDFDAPVASGAAAAGLPPVPAPAPAPAPLSPAEAEDPDVVALSHTLKSLGVGTSAACLNLAKSLADQGVLTIERLKKMPAHQAKKALEIVKMTEFQIDAVMGAVAPPHSAAQAAPVPATAPATALVPASVPISSLGRYAAPGEHVRHEGFFYASAHVRHVDGLTQVLDGDTPVGIDAGFEVAPGDASDVEVANAYAWGSGALVFSDGAYAYSALQIAQLPCDKGAKFSGGGLLKVDSEGRVSTRHNVCDVLLRKRAFPAPALAPAPAPSSSLGRYAAPGEHVFSSQLQQLEAMGFSNRDQNISALALTGGNVEAAVYRLLNGNFN